MRLLRPEIEHLQRQQRPCFDIERCLQPLGLPLEAFQLCYRIERVQVE